MASIQMQKKRFSIFLGICWQIKTLNEEYRKKRKLLLEDTIDVAAFINCILSGYPSSIEDYFTD